MPEIDPDALASKLDTIPEGDREPYVQELRMKGYTWRSSNQPFASAKGINWTGNEEGVEALAPTDPIGKAMQMPGQYLAQKAGIQLNPRTDPLGTMGKMVPSTMNQWGLATVGTPAISAIASPALQKIGDALGFGPELPAGVTKPESITPRSTFETLNPFKLGQKIELPPQEQIMQDAAANYADKAIKLQQHFGPSEDDMGIGTKIQNIIQTNSEAARKAAGLPFEQAKEMAAASDIMPMRPANLADATKAVGMDFENLPPSLRFTKIGSFLRDEATLNPQAQALATGTPTGAQGSMLQSVRSLPELLDMRTELAQLARAQNGAFGTNMPGLAGQINPQGQLFYKFVDAVDKDIATQAKGTDIVDVLGKGRDAWKAFKNTYGDPFIESLLSKNPSEIAESAFRAPENINAIKDAGGDQAIALVKKAVANDIVNGGGRALAKLNIRNPQSVIDDLLAQKGEEMERLFTPDDIGMFRQFGAARNKMITTNPALQSMTSSELPGKALSIASKALPPQLQMAIKMAQAANSRGFLLGGQQ